MILELLLKYPAVRIALAILLDLWSACTVFALAMRNVPLEQFVAFEKSYPRLGHLARAARKFGTDFIPFFQSIVAAFQGLPVNRIGKTLAVFLVGSSLLASGVAVPTLLVGCGPKPRPDGGVVTTPTDWTDTASVVQELLSWALPAARAILDLVLPADARVVVDRILDSLLSYNQRFANVLTTYRARGGDACEVYAASGAIRVGLLELTRVLADNGFALGNTLERALDLVSGFGDNVVSQFARCEPEAGFSSLGASSNQELRSIYDTARTRGPLRHDLDNLRPVSP